MSAGEDDIMVKNTWPCPGKPEALAGQPIGMYHCEFCGEMQLAGTCHLAPQFPSQWEEPFPKVEEPDYGPDDEAVPDGMVSYPRSTLHMEDLVVVGPPHTRGPLVPPSSFPWPEYTPCPACGAIEGVTRSREEERFQFADPPDLVELSVVVDKLTCAACVLEFTDHRAEIAHDAAIKAYLTSKAPR